MIKHPKINRQYHLLVLVQEFVGFIVFFLRIHS